MEVVHCPVSSLAKRGEVGECESGSAKGKVGSALLGQPINKRV